jgi:peptide/nickel transport system substrate-binding protein
VDGWRSPGGQEVARIDDPEGCAAGRRLRGAAGGAGRLRPWALGLAAALAVFAPACSPAPAPPSRTPVTLTIGRPQISQLDPSLGLGRMADLIAHERLTSSDANGRVRGLILDHWTISADGLTWRLTMREALRFQDGSAVTPADVVRTIDKDRQVSADVSACLDDIERVEVAGARDVDVTLRRRCSFLLDDLLETVTRPIGSGSASIGTGAFSVVSLSADELVLAANPNYHGGPPAVDRVVVRSYDALRTAWAEMMRGRLDFLFEVGPDSAEFLSDQRSIDVRTFVGPYANMLLLNSGRAVFRPSNVRRALSLAVDRMALVQQGQKGHGVPASVPTWPNHWASSDTGRPVAFDPERAAALLLAARAGARRVPGPAGTPLLEFTCLVPEKFAVIERLALLVQRQLAEVDVRMRIASIPAEALNGRLDSGDFDAILLPFLSGPYASVPFRTWHSPGKSRRWNFWGYQSAAVDAALDAMRDARDDAAFTQALRQFESAFEEDPPAILLTWNQTIQAVSHRFIVPEAATGRDALHFISRFALRQPGSAP